MEVGGAARSVKYLMCSHKDLASSSEPHNKPDMVVETGRWVPALVQHSKPNQQASGPSDSDFRNKVDSIMSLSLCPPPQAGSQRQDLLLIMKARLTALACS